MHVTGVIKVEAPEWGMHALSKVQSLSILLYSGDSALYMPMSEP